jgi:lysophospholipase L1-like esterase
MRLLSATVLAAGIFLFSALGARAAAPAPGAAPAAGKPTIFVCGDSTSRYSGSETMTSDLQGWGTPIAKFFDPEKVKVTNVGQAGTSSMSFYNGNWPRVLPQIKAGDYVLIVFGINDGSTPKGIGDEVTAGRGGAETHTYGWYMAKMATDALAKGAHPVYLTVTTRNMWTNPKAKFTDATPTGALPADYDPKEDRIERGTANGSFTQWTKDVGRKIHVPVFDLTNCCADLYEKMGREAVNKFYKDHNHTYAAGAATVAKVIASGLKGLKDSPFVPLMSEEGKALAAADAKFISDNLPEAATASAPAGK